MIVNSNLYEKHLKFTSSFGKSFKIKEVIWTFKKFVFILESCPFNMFLYTKYYIYIDISSPSKHECPAKQIKFLVFIHNFCKQIHLLKFSIYKIKSIVPFSTWSLMKWYLIPMCLVFVCWIGLQEMTIALLESQYIGILSYLKP